MVAVNILFLFSLLQDFPYITFIACLTFVRKINVYAFFLRDTETLEETEEQSKPKNETDERWSSSVSPQLGAYKQSNTQSTARVGKSNANKPGFPSDFQSVRFLSMHMPYPCTYTLSILNPFYKPHWGDSPLCKCAQCLSTFSCSDVIE